VADVDDQIGASGAPLLDVLGSPDDRSTARGPGPRYILDDD
jgi:hypothetical protein